MSTAIGRANAAGMGGHRVFGYGSLVNWETHGYADLRPAALAGWRRGWCHTAARAVAFLSIRPDPAASCLGATALVPEEEWTALDAREAAYDRHEVDAGGPVRVYAVPAAHRRPGGPDHPILLSYLDTVVQGFFRLHGPAEAAAFFETTEGWTDVRDDRAAPLYPRATTLTEAERAVVDDGLSGLGIRPA